MSKKEYGCWEGHPECPKCGWEFNPANYTSKAPVDCPECGTKFRFDVRTNREYNCYAVGDTNQPLRWVDGTISAQAKEFIEARNLQRDVARIAAAVRRNVPDYIQGHLQLARDMHPFLVVTVEVACLTGKERVCCEEEVIDDLWDEKAGSTDLTCDVHVRVAKPERSGK